VFEFNNIDYIGIVIGLCLGFFASFLMGIVLIKINPVKPLLEPKNENEESISTKDNKWKDAYYYDSLSVFFEKSAKIRYSFIVTGLLIAFLVGLVAELPSGGKSLVNATMCGLVFTIINFIGYIHRPTFPSKTINLISIYATLPMAVLGGSLI